MSEVTREQMERLIADTKQLEQIDRSLQDIHADFERIEEKLDKFIVGLEKLAGFFTVEGVMKLADGLTDLLDKLQENHP